MSTRDCDCTPSEGLWYALAATAVLAAGVEVVKRCGSSNLPRGTYSSTFTFTDKGELNKIWEASPSSFHGWLDWKDDEHEERFWRAASESGQWELVVVPSGENWDGSTWKVVFPDGSELDLFSELLTEPLKLLEVSDFVSTYQVTLHVPPSARYFGRGMGLGTVAVWRKIPKRPS